MTAERARAAPRPRTEGWSDAAFAGVAEVVHLMAGLVFPPNRQPSAEAGMRRAMATLRLGDVEALRRAVEAPGEARNAVLAELTIGETYFFREEAQLGVLGTHVLPALRDARGPGAPLRLWSAGCASGEEPYTLAILLRELAWPHPARILGTDVARPRLEAARRGRYTRWSMRGAAPERVERWFEHRGTHFQLAPEIRAAVQFAPLNLIADDYPSVQTNTQEQDVVLCRNVLIYWDIPTVQRVATRLLASLAPDGWLLLGASDPPLSDLVDCQTVMLPGGVVYRRADRAGVSRERFAARADTESPARPTPWWQPAIPAGEPAALAAIPVPAPVPTEPRHPDVLPTAGEQEAEGAYAAGDYPRAEMLARRDLGALSPVASWILLVRAMANMGRLREADEECVRALDLHRLSPELHYLHATLLNAAGQRREAANAARRALYLDRQFVMAHLLLGDTMAQLGEPDRAARAFEHALAALAGVADDATLLAADGVPASRLRQVAELRRRGFAMGEPT